MDSRFEFCGTRLSLTGVYTNVDLNTSKGTRIRQLKPMDFLPVDVGNFNHEHLKPTAAEGLYSCLCAYTCMCAHWYAYAIYMNVSLLTCWGYWRMADRFFCLAISSFHKNCKPTVVTVFNVSFQANSWDTDHTPHFAASDLCLSYLPPILHF